MVFLHTLSFYLHITVGSAALILFWVPVLSRKGSLDHRRFGRYYAATMKAVAFTGAAMALMVLAVPHTIKAEVINQSSDPERAVVLIRVFWGLLLYLALLTYTSVQQGLVVLGDTSGQMLKRWQHLVFPASLALSAPLMVFLGIHYHQTLPVVFGCLGGVIGINALRYCLASEHSPAQRIIEHLGAICGSGIGAYTAFFAFGGRSILGNIGEWQIAFWVLPGVIGSVFIRRAARRYQAQGDGITPGHDPGELNSL